MCYILNDLLNRELIRLNFKFDTPVVKDESASSPSKGKVTYEDPDLEEYLI